MEHTVSNRRQIRSRAIVLGSLAALLSLAPAGTAFAEGFFRVDPIAVSRSAADTVLLLRVVDEVDEILEEKAFPQAGKCRSPLAASHVAHFERDDCWGIELLDGGQAVSQVRVESLGTYRDDYLLLRYPTPPAAGVDTRIEITVSYNGFHNQHHKDRSFAVAMLPHDLDPADPAVRALRDVDDRLNDTYRSLLNVMTGYPALRQRTIEAQRAWLADTDRRCPTVQTGRKTGHAACRLVLVGERLNIIDATRRDMDLIFDGCD